MSTATRGTVLAGRYRLEERIQSNADGTLWRAVDSTLDRRVSIRVMRPAHPFAADVADAARRAALIDDVRLVRVLDVGSDGDVGFVVSEDVEGDTLAALVERSPLAPPVVRRIVGEVAQGLDAAGTRGLHHLCLTPRSVIVCRDGSVKIVGTAVEAAAAGLEPAHAATANRDDATALVGLLYSGLTGRWPLGNAGFPPAPRGEGGAPVPPADLVRGIPNDLDTLCVVTLGGSADGPRSPAELAKELAPWPSAEEAPLRAAPRRLPSDAPPAPLAADSPLKIRSRPVSKRGAGAKPARSATSPSVPAATGTGATGTGAATAGTGAEDASTTGPGEPPAGAGQGNTPRRSATMFPTSVALTGSLPIPKEPATGGPRRMDSLFSPQPVDQPANQGSDIPAAPAAPVKAAEPDPHGPTAPIQTRNLVAGKPQPSTPPVSAAAGPTAADRTAPGGRTAPTAGTSSTIKEAPETKPTARAKPAGKAGPAGTASPASKAATGKAAGSTSPAEPMVPWNPTWSKAADPGSGPEPNGPFPILIPAETPPREQSRLVIFSITVVLLLGLVVAAFSLRDIGSNGDSVQPAETGAPLPSSTGEGLAPTAVTPTTIAPVPTTAEPTATTPVPVSIASIRAVDPEGDGDEDSASSPLAVDGDESTSWHSQIYRTSSFGGLKNGVGLSLKLKQSATLTSATIDVSGTGGTVEVRTGSSPDVTSSRLLGRGTINNGQVTVEARNAKPARYVILWFTKLPSVGGNYKIEVSEVRLK